MTKDEAISKALEALETAWTYDEDNADGYYFEAITALREAQRPWVGLTDEEAQWLYDNCRTPSNLIDMTEAKLKELNT